MIAIISTIAVVIVMAGLFILLARSTRQKVKLARWPLGGTRFRSNVDLEVIALTTWAAPFTGGDKRVLPAGEEFTVMDTPGEGSTAVGCLPVRYDDLHQNFVNSVDRANLTYSGYYLVVSIQHLRTSCTVV